MNRRTFESRVALMMLPVGALLTLGALVGAVAMFVLIADAVWRWPGNAGWRIGWGLAGALAVAFTLRKGIETMATFDWRVAIAPLAVSGAVVAAWPGWWS